MRSILLTILVILGLSACTGLKKNDLGASPFLYKVGEGAIIMITEPFHVGGRSISFKKGEKQNWLSLGAYDEVCSLMFDREPNKEVSKGRYQVKKATYQEFDQSGGQYTAITTLSLMTIDGEPANTLRCEQSGYYNEGDTGPITVQSFKHSVGRYLKLILRSECDEPDNQNLCSSTN